MEKEIEFINWSEIPTNRDASEFLFSFSIVDSNLVGKPEEESKKKHYQIKAFISRTLRTIWERRSSGIDVKRVLYEYCKRHLVNKLKEDTLLEEEEIWFTTSSHPKDCPFDSSKISMMKGEKITVKLNNGKLMQDKILLQLATSIIEIRDYINAIFKERHGGKLLILKEERDVLQFFISTNSSEEFIYRLSALRNVVTNLNEAILREITKIDDSQVKSLSLLEKYLLTYNNYDDFSIKVFRSINRLRQAYPIHGDNINGVQDAHKFFKLEYPISDYSESWKKLLINYLDALRRILETIQNK